MAAAEIVDLAKGAGDVAKSISDIVDAWNKINTSRQIIMDVRNETNLVLTRESEVFKHGGYGDPPATDHIDPKTAQLFLVGTVGGGVMTGVEGQLGWRIQPDQAGDALALAYFDNPWVGSNKGEAHIQGANGAAFKIRATVGSGDKAHFIYEVMYA